MIFSELYSAYYNTVAHIMEKALQPETTEKDLQRCVAEEAFSESTLTILPSLKSGKWPLLHKDLSPVLQYKPTMPLTNLQKSWLKAIAADPRIQLFDAAFPNLDDVPPLFTKADYCIYDQYSDGDPFDDAIYIQHFRMMRQAMRENLAVLATMQNRYCKEVQIRFYPKHFEYSLKDDKIRIVVSGCQFRYFNLGRILHCAYCDDDCTAYKEPQPLRPKNLTLQIIDQCNALERAMLHFAHFEKQVERTAEDQYILRLKYDESDETEMVIRVLSFGRYLKVLKPQSFVNLIKRRLTLQKNCGL